MAPRPSENPQTRTVPTRRKRPREPPERRPRPRPQPGGHPSGSPAPVPELLGGAGALGHDRRHVGDLRLGLADEGELGIGTFAFDAHDDDLPRL